MSPVLKTRISLSALVLVLVLVALIFVLAILIVLILAILVLVLILVAVLVLILVPILVLLILLILSHGFSVFRGFLSACYSKKSMPGAGFVMINSHCGKRAGKNSPKGL